LGEDFELKPIKEGDKNPSQHLEFINIKTSTQMAQKFIILPTSPNPNPYVFCTVNNMNLIVILNNERKDWTKINLKIIRGLEIMADIQQQLQNIIQLAEVANTQLAEIETMILQANNTYKIQTVCNIISISEDLQNIIQGDMENQAYYIQTLLANEFDRYKGKGNSYIDNHIKEIQDIYKTKHQNVEQLIIVNQEKKKED